MPFHVRGSVVVERLCLCSSGAVPACPMPCPKQTCPTHYPTRQGPGTGTGTGEAGKGEEEERRRKGRQERGNPHFYLRTATTLLTFWAPSCPPIEKVNEGIIIPYHLLRSGTSYLSTFLLCLELFPTFRFWGTHGGRQGQWD